MKFIRDYADLLGVTVTVQQFDGGQTITLSTADRQSQYRATVYWGEEWAAERRLMKWLHTQPWPTEDDPRVITEGSPV